MKTRFIYCLLLTFSTAFAGEAEYKEPTEADFQAANEKEIQKRAVDNPELAKMLQARDEQNDSEQLEAKPEAKVRDFAPSTEIADQAFKNGDYKTALKHYEALGEDGDDRASMVTGLIYSEGAKGIKADKGKAAAWFKRSGDQGGTEGADLYKKMDNKNELSQKDRIEAANLTREFRESDARLTIDQQTLMTDPYSSGTDSPISGTGSQQHLSKSALAQTSDANIHVGPSNIKANFSPDRLNSGDYSYQPEKNPPDYSSPARE